MNKGRQASDHVEACQTSVDKSRAATVSETSNTPVTTPVKTVRATRPSGLKGLLTPTLSSRAKVQLNDGSASASVFFFSGAKEDCNAKGEESAAIKVSHTSKSTESSQEL